jgi:hypothetical protein
MKKCTYEWREKNPDKYREISRNGYKKYFENNKEKCRERARKYYYLKKAKKEEELKSNQENL